MKREEEKICSHLVISGRVQGVFYRATMQEIAREHGLTGWVKNCVDGRVEAFVEGERSAVESVIRWCRTGPPGAQVTGVEITMKEATEGFGSFSIRY